jgi:CO/xanthine dehydrogenase Mo-binding subunit
VALRKGATWSEGETLPDENDLAGFLKSQPSEPTVIDQRTTSAARQQLRTIRRQYSRPYIAHASIAPSCAIAEWKGDRVHVWTHSQDVYLLRADLALVLRLPVENITVEHLEGAGCYGHNAADDVALDAVLLARAASAGRCACNGRARTRCRRRRSGPLWRSRSKPISTPKVKSSTGGTQSGAMVMPPAPAAPRSRRCLPPSNCGSVSAHDLEQSAAGQWRRRRPQLDPAHDLPSWHIESHRLLTMPVRTSALRTLGAQGNVFAIESFLDEIASGRGEDPVAFRLRHLSDERARDVIRAVATRGETGSIRDRPRYRLCPLQEHWRLLCRSGRGGRR